MRYIPFFLIFLSVFLGFSRTTRFSFARNFVLTIGCARHLHKAISTASGGTFLVFIAFDIQPVFNDNEVLVRPFEVFRRPHTPRTVQPARCLRLKQQARNPSKSVESFRHTFWNHAKVLRTSFHEALPIHPLRPKPTPPTHIRFSIRCT